MTSKKTLQNNILAIYGLLFLLALLPISTSVQAAENPPVVLELFTSKYCPACPQADKNFNALLASNPDVIALSCHVTYFNSRKRSDILSHPFCDARQNIYANALGTGGIFTPMTVINGQSYTTGVRDNDMQSKINSAHKTYRSVGLSKNGEYLDISLPAITADQPMEIWLLEIVKMQSSSGYSHYRNTVSNISKLLDWKGQPVNLAFPVSDGGREDRYGYSVLVQTRNGQILAAGRTGF